ncbi:unnamed protein product, partial [Heligmosomoides polygyrus]|uniref:G-patch domain-containing protein n=1 Tax=Heligmosomoides polygyrus TaxID=6339 RepID=A0A183FLX0_HELPZ
KSPSRHHCTLKTPEAEQRFHGAFTGGFSAGYFNTVGSKEGYKAGDKRMAWERDASSSSSTSMALQLENIIRPVSDSIGKRMLRAMGWREGRGVGLVTAKSKRHCEFSRFLKMKAAAPAGFDPAAEDVLMTRLRSVEGLHGLGYEAMSATTVLDEKYGRVSSAFKTKAKSRGIRGQAFGVGAFEDEDENIYTNYDLNQFDFALDAPGTSDDGAMSVDSTFVMAGKRLNPRKFYPPPKLPPNFRPAHRPKALEKAKLPTTLQNAMETLTAVQRAKLLGEDRVSVMELVSDKDRKRLAQHRSRWDQRERSTGAGVEEWRRRFVQDRVEYPDEPMKQARFKEFLKYLRRGLVLPQPKELSVWEWESERKEFETKLTAEERGMLPEVRARTQPLAKSSLALPIQELLQNKFAKETGVSGSKHDSDKVAAVKMGMFGERTRTTFQWYPHNSLAKRFNIPNPYPGAEIVGVPHLQKTLRKETLLNLGLPQTANEMANRWGLKRAGGDGALEPSDEKDYFDKDKPKEPKDDDLDRPPKSIFDAIFGESESDSDSEEEEQEEKKNKEPEKPEPSDKQPKKEVDDGIKKEVEEQPPKPIPITVLDSEEEVEIFGPAPPPSSSECELRLLLA